MKGIITSISEIIKGNQNQYIKIGIDEILYNMFINNLNDKTILVNLQEGQEIEFELGENAGFQFISKINILKPNNHTIIFKQSLSKPSFDVEDKIKERSRQQNDIILESLFRSVCENSKKNEKVKILVDKTLEVYKLLFEEK